MIVSINPGTGPVSDNGTNQSEINIKKFIEDLGVNATFEFKEVLEDGRHSYEIHFNGNTHYIDMPAIPIENVRYVGGPEQNIWHFPRLYVDGSSWVWKYALNVCDFIGDEDEY